ncbi:MAG: hypothetical protein EB117_12385 [Betaproteobacteria bacterium]|nr:hypothetical protein [Betaproteobacteria bacterium]
MNALTKNHSVEELGRIGQIFVTSGFFSDTKDAAQAIVKVMAGQELGFAPIASMTGVYIVKGKVSLSANLMAAAIKRSGRYTFKVLQLDAKECSIEFYEILGGKRESIGISSFTMAEAAQAGLAGSATWKNFPRNMLYARAMSNGAKWYCPDVFGGPIYTPDELGAVVDGETGEMVDLEPEKPATVNSATSVPVLPQADVKFISDEQVEALGVIRDGLADYDYRQERYLEGVKKVLGVELSSWEDESFRLLTEEQAERLISKTSKVLQDLDEQSAAAARTMPTLDGPKF